MFPKADFKIGFGGDCLQSVTIIWYWEGKNQKFAGIQETGTIETHF